MYTDSELLKIGKYIKHDRDNLFTYSGLQQLVDKYLIKNRNTGQIYETPQFAYMLIAMIAFGKYPNETRLKYIKRAYDAFSKFKINLPTPIMAGVRTNIKQFSSCILIDVDDSLDSIFASNTATGLYTSKRAGIGLNVGRIRPINSPIRGGEVIHTGLIPYLKVFESTCKSTSQNGIRGGCFSKDTEVLTIDSVEIDGKIYNLDDEILVDGKLEKVYTILEKGNTLNQSVKEIVCNTMKENQEVQTQSTSI
jgi:ribonucleoside-diphosphate reductase alpha chain